MLYKRMGMRSQFQNFTLDLIPDSRYVDMEYDKSLVEEDVTADERRQKGKGKGVVLYLYWAFYGDYLLVRVSASF
jgi:hypothetical protein